MLPTSNPAKKREFFALLLCILITAKAALAFCRACNLSLFFIFFLGSSPAWGEKTPHEHLYLSWLAVAMVALNFLVFYFKERAALLPDYIVITLHAFFPADEAQSTEAQQCNRCRLRDKMRVRAEFYQHAVFQEVQVGNRLIQC